MGMEILRFTPPGMAGIAALLFFLAGCASQLPPSGGPPDAVPPGIVSVTPTHGTLNFRDSKIAVEFSEYVDRRSFQESVFLSPPAGALRFEWGGTDVEIFFGDTLRELTTYIVTIGTDLKDTRNNSLDSAFTFAFSTGDLIDSCAVSGKIHDARPGGVMVFAYHAGAEHGAAAVADTIDPRRVKPDYLTQSGTDGTFRIPHMRPGRYRVIAVRDVFKNLLYDVQTDAYGMSTSDILVGAERAEVGGVQFMLTIQDTLPPFLSGARTTDHIHMRLRFNEPVDPGSLRKEDVTVDDTLGGNTLEVLDLSPADTSGKEFLLTTSAQDSAAVYRVSLRSLRDRAGNRAAGTGLSTLALGSGVPDTTAPAVLISITADSVRDIAPAAVLRFNPGEAVDTSALRGGLHLTDGRGDPVRGTLEWRGAAAAAFRPADQFIRGAWYRLTLVLDSLRDLAGNTRGDSVLVRHFRIAEEKNLGSIGGSVIIGSSPGGVFAPSGPVLVSARNLTAGESATVAVRADSTGSFILENLREGKYRITAFEDADSNGTYSHGLPFPARYSELFSVYPDTLKVRPRWPIEGVNLRFLR